MFRILAGVPRAMATVMVESYFEELAAACRALSGPGGGPKVVADVQPAGGGHEAVFDMPGSRRTKQ